MVELNEVIVLVIIAVGFIPMLMSLIKDRDTIWLFLAYSALLLGAIFTIVEDFVYHTEMNYAEHLIGVMLAGILFIFCTYMNYRKIRLIDKRLDAKLKRGKK